MPRGLIRSLIIDALWSVGFGAVALGLLIFGARWLHAVHGPIHEAGWTQRSRAAFVASGFHGAELDQASGRYFSWSDQRSQLSFPQLNRHRAHRVTLLVRSSRPASVPTPQLNIVVDGQLQSAEPVPDAPTTIVFEIPRRPEPGAVVTLDVAPAYQPGGPDPRTLGVVIDDVGLEPVNGAFVPTWRVLLLAALAVFAMTLGVRLAGARGWIAAATSLAAAAGVTWLLLADAAFIGLYVERLVRIGFGASVAGALVGLVRARWPTIGGVPEWSVAAAILIVLSAIKIGIFWHPLAVVGDGIFQVHRAQVVHGGQYFFTSVTPKPFFEFPYPVALYVVAQPFWSLFPADLDLLRLLRCVAIIADALVGLALYGAIRRQWDDRSIAFWCAALWPFARAPFEALCNANLTNLFGQSAFGAAIAGVAWLAASDRQRMAGALAIVGLVVVGFLSHFGTVTVGLGVLLVAAGLLIVAGQGIVRRAGLWVVGITIAASLVSWLVYYSHSTFIDVYKNTWASVAAQQPDDSSKVVASPIVKLQRWWSGTGDDYGRPGLAVLLVAFGGALIVLRRYARQGASLVFMAWLLAWVAMTLVGLLTPITLRANLAAAPVFIALSAIAIGEVGKRSRLGAVAIAAVVAADGLAIAVRCLAISTHN